MVFAKAYNHGSFDHEAAVLQCGVDPIIRHRHDKRTMLHEASSGQQSRSIVIQTARQLQLLKPGIRKQPVANPSISFPKHHHHSVDLIVRPRSESLVRMASDVAIADAVMNQTGGLADLI